MFAICSRRTFSGARPMNDQLRAYLDEQASELEESVRQALSITNGDAMAALRALLIAISFMQEEIDGLKTNVSSGFTRGRVKRPAPKHHTAEEFLAAVAAGTADRGACMVIWRLLRNLTGAAKIDTSEPEGEWSVRIQKSPDVRYTNLYDEKC